jgi:hypothetical protein
MKTKFLELLREVKRPGIEDLVQYLLDSDFFEAPASSEFHLNVPGGLLEHSLNVYNSLVGIAGKYSPTTPRESIILAGLGHDLCKIGLYVRDFRNKKINGKWEQVEYWNHDDKFPVGHGEKSVIILQKYIKLTDEEIYSVRFHMASWDCEGYSQKKSLNGAMDKCKLLKCLIIADQVATFFMEDK